MAVTLYSHRLLLIVPAGKVAPVAAWFRANVDPTFPLTIGPGLSVNGAAGDTPTHRWCSAAWTDAQCKAILIKLCQLAAIALPTGPQWAAWTGTQKVGWLKSVQAGLWTGYGIHVDLMPNDGDWDAPADALAARGVKVIAAAAVA